jgi:prevent-host-death family protein
MVRLEPRTSTEVKPTGRVREVAVTELRRGTAAVVDRVCKGEAAVIVKHGRPLAMLLPFDDLERLRPIELGDADLEPFVAAFKRREDLRRSSELSHGRWVNGHGINGPYRRYRRGREPGGRRR